MKGYYRMIDKPDDAAITMNAILAPHRERTLQRMMAQHTVLCTLTLTEIDPSLLKKTDPPGYRQIPPT